MTTKPPVPPHQPSSQKPHPLLADAPWLTTTTTQRVFDALQAAGIAVRAVGGTVRNTLLGEDVSDIDLAVDAPPNEVAEAARRAGLKVVPTGIDHGTLTIVVNAIPFEVTSLRRDVATDGRRATIAYTDDWQEDARRRDFTINALYCDRSGVLFDPVGGLADIAARRVRFIGDPHARIQEDYLRILRFFRFSAQYSGRNLDETGLAACISERAGLQRLSAERIHHELHRLLKAPAALAVIRQIAPHGFIDDLVGRPGDIATLGALVAMEPQAHQALAVVHGTAVPDPVLRLAALAVSSAEDVPRLKQRLRLSNSEADRLSGAAHVASLVGTYPTPQLVHGLVYRHGNRAATDGLLLAWARQAAQGTAPDAARDRETETALLDAAATWTPPKLPISGSDLIALGVPAGPQIGVVIEAFETWWIAAGFPDDRACINARLAELVVVTNR
ncbi:MAG: CCA tRNA nucleotidyltransferase [Hyphomicrobiaceae bacterium]|nr:CCA tRNA nucleotidyltransferase [Hyphomicrobiaceae bacterium]MCC0008453.1 CCA tRNA nucleotidyltransferase [Hyphomicrobiaceae bacterium]